MWALTGIPTCWSSWPFTNFAVKCSTLKAGGLIWHLVFFLKWQGDFSFCKVGSLNRVLNLCIQTAVWRAGSMGWAILNIVLCEKWWDSPLGTAVGVPTFHCHRTDCNRVLELPLYLRDWELWEEMDHVYLVHNCILSPTLRTMPGIEQVLRKYLLNGEKKNFSRRLKETTMDLQWPRFLKNIYWMRDVLFIFFSLG